MEKKISIKRYIIEGLVIAAVIFAVYFGGRMLYSLGVNTGKDEAIQTVNELLNGQSIYILDKYGTMVYHSDDRKKSNNWCFIPNKTIQMKYDMSTLIFNYVDYDSLPEGK